MLNGQAGELLCSQKSCPEKVNDTRTLGSTRSGACGQKKRICLSPERKEKEGKRIDNKKPQFEPKRVLRIKAKVSYGGNSFAIYYWTPREGKKKVNTHR